MLTPPYLDNSPNVEGRVVPELALMLAEMEPHARQHVVHLLDKFPRLSLTSGRRSVERNRAVGGVPGSLHLQGRAADFAGRPDDLKAAYAYCVRGGRPGTPGGPTECLLETSGPQRTGGGSTGAHLHVAW